MTIRDAIACSVWDDDRPALPRFTGVRYEDTEPLHPAILRAKKPLRYVDQFVGAREDYRPLMRRILDTLDCGDWMHTVAIRDRVGGDRRNITAALERLLDRGLVERMEDRSEGRMQLAWRKST